MGWSLVGVALIDWIELMKAKPPSPDEAAATLTKARPTKLSVTELTYLSVQTLLYLGFRSNSAIIRRSCIYTYTILQLIIGRALN